MIREISLKFVVITCSTCGEHFAITTTRSEELQKTHEDFYCPKGHEQYFPRQYTRKPKGGRA